MNTRPTYMHIHTGSVDIGEGWIQSYDPSELEMRGLTASEAFDEDHNEYLLNKPTPYIGE